MNTRFGAGYCLGALPGSSEKTEVCRIDGEDVAVKMSDFLKYKDDFFMEQCEVEKQTMIVKNKMNKTPETEAEIGSLSLFARILEYFSSDKAKIADNESELVKLNEQSQQNEKPQKIDIFGKGGGSPQRMP